MKPYAAMWSARVRALLQYRAAAVAGLSTQVFWGFIRVMIFEAFYRSSDATHPMSLPEVVTYIWLGQALFRFIPWDVEPELRGMIRDGKVAYEMLRPVDTFGLWYARTLAMRVAPTLLRAVPMAAMAVPFFGMGLPPTWEAAGAFALALFGATLLSAAITLLMTITLLWTISGTGVVRLMPGIIFLFSGMSIPLPLMPDWVLPVVNALPFRDVIDAPFRLYMGHLSPEAAFAVFGRQIAWTLGLAGFGRWLLARGVRRLVVQGG